MTTVENAPAQATSPVDVPQQRPELFTDFASVETWYRNLGPDVDIRDVSTSALLDGLSVALFDVVGEPPLATPIERTKRLLQLTTEPEKMANKVALEGARGLTLTDLMFELTENMGRQQPPIQESLFNFGAAVCLKLRENEALPVEDRIRANKNLVTLRQAQIDKQLEFGVLGNTGSQVLSHEQQLRLHEEKTRSIMTAEAKWIADHGKRAKAGPLFETLIGVTTKYLSLEMGVSDHLSVRHATLREDSPSRKVDGGRGHRFAHDVVLSVPGNRKSVQVKWGPGADESHERYDDSLAFISENGDDGVLSNSAQIAGFFEAIAQATRGNNRERVDSLIHRYGLDTIATDLLGELQVRQGMAAVAVSAAATGK